MLKIDRTVQASDLVTAVESLYALASGKLASLISAWPAEKGGPVYTVRGKYTQRGWTEWTQGFLYGSALMLFDVTGDREFFELGREHIHRHMAKHVSHTGVHDHGFTIISTYGTILRLMNEGAVSGDAGERGMCELALKVSGAVQASRWTALGANDGFIYSFNGPHSLFADTMRSLRSLAVAHQLGHVLKGEQEEEVNLLHRLIAHAETTARYAVYFGNGRDYYDTRGRVAHESLFNVKTGTYRCPGTQQGYSPFSTWMRGLAWILCGYAEQLEFLQTLLGSEFEPVYEKGRVLQRFEETARAVADHYITGTPHDGIPYWDTGAPGLADLGDYLDRPSQPFNAFEPVDSSAAVIAAQGLIRLGRYLQQKGNEEWEQYYQAGLTVARHAFDDPYLSRNPGHQGLVLHSVYHRPAGWDYIPEGHLIPCGESSMWGDYHALELGLMILRIARRQPYYTFFIDREAREHE